MESLKYGKVTVAEEERKQMAVLLGLKIAEV